MTKSIEFEKHGVRIWKDADTGEWGGTDSAAVDQYRQLEEGYFAVFQGYHPHPDYEFGRFLGEDRNVKNMVLLETDYGSPEGVDF